MRACAISFKECWQDATGRWVSYGGFPLQMGAIASMFDEFDLLIVGVEPRTGGIALPQDARIVPMIRPAGEGARRKMSVLMRLPHYLFLLAKYVRRADVVHVPLPGDIPLLGLFVALIFRKRLIARYGSSWAVTSQTTLMNRFTKTCLRVIAGGRNVAFVTGAHDLPPRVRSIFATALSRAEVDAIRSDLNRGLSPRPNLAYVGRLSPEKGVHYLIETIARLRRTGFDPLPRLSIIGDGPERSALESQVRRGECEDLIQFEGQLNRSDLSMNLESADICVQPSLTEGFSKAWLDAMAHGIPVLASDVGAARDVIGVQGERGWLVPAGNVEALVNTLHRALSVPRDWPRLRHSCRAYAEMHTLERWQTQIAEACVEQWRASVESGKLRLSPVLSKS